MTSRFASALMSVFMMLPSSCITCLADSAINPWPPDAPVLRSPANQATGLDYAIALQWNITDYAWGGYRVQVAQDSAFQSPLFFDRDSIRKEIQAISGLEIATTYYWRVCARNDDGVGPWSAVWSFTTSPSPHPAPNLLLPFDSSKDVSLEAEFQWSSQAKGITAYRLQVSTSPSFPSTVLDTTLGRVVSVRVNPLSPRSRYWWRLRSYSTAIPSPWSSIRQFLTRPATPVLLSPPNGFSVGASSALLEWNPVPDARLYRVRVESGPGFTVSDSTAATNYRVTNMFQIGDYWWRIMAVDSIGVSDWSGLWQFRAGIVGAVGDAPSASVCALMQNHPNPFHEHTTIPFSLTAPAVVTLTVHDVLGRIVATLADGSFEPGDHALTFPPREIMNQLPMGLYLCRLQSGAGMLIKTMTLLR